MNSGISPFWSEPVIYPGLALLDGVWLHCEKSVNAKTTTNMVNTAFMYCHSELDSIYCW